MKLFFTIAFLLMLAAAGAQSNNTLRLQRTYPGPVADAALDNLGNLYLVTENGQIRKYGPEGDSLSVFNNVRRSGKLQTLDVSNPLRPLLFYKDFGQIVLLDRFLAAQATIDLRRLGILQPLAAALSFDNRVWVFDALTNTLRKLDEQGNTLQETPDLRQVFAGGLQPQHIFDHNGWVYLYDPAQGLFVFDYYGTFKRKIPVTNWRNVLVTDKAVVGFAGTGLHTYNLGTLMQTEQPLPDVLNGCNEIKMGNQKLAALCSAGVKIFSYVP